MLLASSAYGLHAFQYDGWRFQEFQLTGPPLISGPGIASLRSYVFGSEGLVGTCYLMSMFAPLLELNDLNVAFLKHRLNVRF